MYENTKHGHMNINGDFCFEVSQSCTTTPDAPLLFMIKFECFKLSGNMYLVCKFTHRLSICSRYQHIKSVSEDQT